MPIVTDSRTVSEFCKGNGANDCIRRDKRVTLLVVRHPHLKNCVAHDLHVFKMSIVKCNLVQSKSNMDGKNDYSRIF